MYKKTHCKVCAACKVLKDLTEFPPDRRARDGRQSRCRHCINAWMREHYRKDVVAGMLRRARVRAAQTGLEFDLEPSDLQPLPELCPVFGHPLRVSAGPQDPWAHSLDRIDNTRGYVRGNVAVISYKANRLKNDGTSEEHQAVADWMRSHNV